MLWTIFTIYGSRNGFFLRFLDPEVTPFLCFLDLEICWYIFLICGPRDCSISAVSLSRNSTIFETSGISLHIFSFFRELKVGKFAMKRFSTPIHPNPPSAQFYEEKKLWACWVWAPRCLHTLGLNAWIVGPALT